MSLSFFNYHLTYCVICSSSKPIVLTQYPFAQKCRPQYQFFNWGYLSNTLIALFPFIYPTTCDTEYLGGIHSTKCIWSTCTLPATISTFFHAHNSRIISRADLPTSPCSILNRYLGHHTKWYLHSHTACANFLKLLNRYLLAMFRVTHPHLKEVFFFIKRFIVLHAKHSWDHLLSRWFKHFN